MRESSSLIALACLLLLSGCGQSTPSAPSIQTQFSGETLVGKTFRAQSEGCPYESSALGNPTRMACDMIEYQFGEDTVEIRQRIREGVQMLQMKEEPQAILFADSVFAQQDLVKMKGGQYFTVLKAGWKLEDAQYVRVDWSQGHTEFFAASGANSDSELLKLLEGGRALESVANPSFRLVRD